jgi:hypothetical protein
MAPIHQPISSLRPLSVIHTRPTRSAAEKLRHDFGGDVVSCEDSLGASVGAGGKQNERSAARLRSEVEARPLHSLRQLPANAPEGIPDAVRRPEVMTAASATRTDLITSLPTSLVRLRKGPRQHVHAPGPPNVPGALITLRRDALG